MLNLIKKWLQSSSNPIGIDLGTDTIRMAQCVEHLGRWQLLAAACTEVPLCIRHDPDALARYHADTLQELHSLGHFEGRDVVLCVPATQTHIQYLRTPVLDDETHRRTLPDRLRGIVPYDPTQSVLRHMIAGNIDEEQQLIVIATPRTAAEKLLHTAELAKLNVVGMNVQPKAILDCFNRIYTRKMDNITTFMFVEMGSTCSRIYVSHAGQLLFARTIPIAGDDLTRAVSYSLHIPFEDAKLLRIKLAATDSLQSLNLSPADRRTADTFAHLSAPIPADLSEQAIKVQAACATISEQFIAQLIECRNTHNQNFPAFNVDRLVFIGNEANHRPLCQHIARTLSLPAQIGDAMTRLSKPAHISMESGIDFSKPQPAWAVAVGLSMGVQLARTRIIA